MKEKTPFRIVGGTDYESSKEKETKPVPEHVSYHDVPGELVGKEYSDPDVDGLMDAFAALLYQPLREYIDAKIDQAEVEKSANEVKILDVKLLYAYLMRPDIWDRPSVTKAVLDEVAYRIMKQDFSPRG